MGQQIPGELWGGAQGGKGWGRGGTSLEYNAIALEYNALQSGHFLQEN